MTTRKRKAEEVEPTLIEPPRILTGAEEWLRDQRERVERLAREYSPHEITTAQDYRDSKRARTAARKAIKEVEDSRREQVGAIKDAVREFEAEVRDLLAPLSGVDDGYRDAIRAWEALVVESRLQAIEAWYVEEGGVVVEAVPFSRILDRWGAEGKWRNYGTNEVAIKEDLTRRVRSIEADLAAIDLRPLTPAEAAEVPTNAFRMSRLAEGQTAVVAGLSPSCRGALRRRLMDLGFVRGSRVSVGMRSPLGNPVAYVVRGTAIALRREQARQIIVTPL